ncbi:MAG: type VII secretion target [Actinocatenispora sp.]
MGDGEPAGAVPMRTLAGSLGQAADGVAATARELSALGPGSGSAGGDLPGTLGRLSHRLYRQWEEAVAARADEARGVARRLTELETAVRRARDRYDEADDDAARGLRDASSGGVG